MKTSWKLPNVSTISRWILQKPSHLLWVAGGGASLAVVLMSCATTRTMLAPPSIPGATFVGTKECATCHEKLVRDFRTADHAKLQAKGKNALEMGCESCHGPGSKHVEAGGGAGTIVNPRKSPETCFQCHIDKKAQFMLPYTHPVLAGKVSCSDCHNPHTGNAVKGGGTQLAGKAETCQQCHKQQTGPFVFPHAAVREGCTACHSPHGSVNQKMLNERNQTLCLKCHVDANTKKNIGMSAPGNGGTGHSDIGGDWQRGTCWSAGCHQAIHGSNVNFRLQY
ncbi:MAG: cytochrome c3 family protein [Verrucomicrobiota bacterium]